MVGYVLGLGDRHCENILFDSNNAECVHVDFACLFEKGLWLAQPEIVPFRLTANMVDILGVTGTEGVYREASEVTMSLLRDKQDLLMTNLETFLHDPLVEWHKGKEDTEREATSMAQHMLNRVRAKLNGQGGTIKEAIQGVVTSSELPLSINSQVHRLIAEATADDKLAGELGRACCIIYYWGLSER
jgi:serine/threonine-protein kinase ATR|eukprot:COSAG01_NODE_2567_length_7445_cov_1.752655_2_plen_187_part_00